ncbi:MAG: hypothetical protein GY853_10390 [PVC group bacterium]|nr:hypothetical protein [PVC group bacterium]
MQDYVWEKNQIDEKIPVEIIPTRIAIAALAVFLSNDEEKRKLLIANPHPESWNSWMLPYGSIIIDNSKLCNNDITFIELESILDITKVENINKLTSESNMQINQYFEEDIFHLPRTSELINYSLKYSKSSNKWTAYSFNYYMINLNEIVNPKCAFEWISLAGSNISQIVNAGKYKDVKLESNLQYLLKTKYFQGYINIEA